MTRYNRMEARGMLESLPVRARVAFLLAIGEHALALVGLNRDWRQLGNSALNDAWRWAHGDNVSPSRFNKYFHDENDNGIDIYSQQSSGVEELAWIILGNIILYVAWHAYHAVGENEMPETVNEVTEEVLDDVLRLAEDLPNLTPDALEKLTKYLVAHYHGDVGELGPPIDRSELLAAVQLPNLADRNP